jgi:hypothetical protein
LGLLLRQCGHGVLYEYFATEELDEDEAPKGLREIHLHVVSNVRTWLFTNDNPNKHWITPGDVSPYFSKDTQYPESVFETLSQKDKDTAERIGKIELWEELHHDDVYAWGARDEKEYMESDEKSDEE